MWMGRGLRDETMAGKLLIWFMSKLLVFCQKMSKWAIRSKKWVIHSFAHFWWAKCAILSHRSFPLSDLSESLMIAHFWWAKWVICSHCSFDLREMSDSRFTHIAHQKRGNEQKWAIRSLIQNFLSKSLIHSFPLSNLSKLLMVAHLSWATWVIRSRSLICLERYERIAHSHSFDLSEMSQWSNERMSEWAMSEWANSQPWKWLNITLWI